MIMYMCSINQAWAELLARVTGAYYNNILYVLNSNIVYYCANKVLIFVWNIK